MRNRAPLMIGLSAALVLTAFAFDRGPVNVFAAGPGYKSCSGAVNADNSVSPGQTDFCTMFTGTDLPTGSEITVTVTSPTGSAVTWCQGIVTPTYSMLPEGGLLTTFCPLKVVSGSVQSGQEIGLERIAIPTSTATGTAVVQEGFICPSGGFTVSCPGLLGPGPFSVCGPGSVIGQVGTACPGSTPTPITLNVPVPGVAFLATSPAGAVATFSVTASGGVGTITISCTPPSGSTFPIGVTTVNCSASDGSGDSATASFTVDVWGAAMQLEVLQSSVLSGNAGIGASLTAKIQSVLATLAAGVTTAACNGLNAFTNEVLAQSGHKITISDANFLIGQVQQIEAVVPCA